MREQIFPCVLFLLLCAVTVKPNTLRDMVSHMTDKVGLVHQVPIMCDGDLRFSRQVEQVCTKLLCINYSCTLEEESISRRKF